MFPMLITIKNGKTYKIFVKNFFVKNFISFYSVSIPTRKYTYK